MAFTTSRGRTQTSLEGINITPLVDVVLVLLLIFMVTAPVLQSGVEVAVPQTRTVNQLIEQHRVITLDKDQNVFLDDKPVNVHDLPSILEHNGETQNGEAHTGEAKQTVYVRADQRVPFGAFATVMDAVKQAGIANISIVTQPLK